MADDAPRLRGAIVPVTPFQQNCAILWDDATKRGVVVDPGGDVDRIVAAVAQTGAAIERILLTHGHLDHAGGTMDGIAAQAASYGFEAANAEPDNWLAEGDSIEFAGHRFDVLHCPGHTPGHVVFVDHAARFLIAGDVLFQGSVGRTDFPYGDHDALIAAIKGKLLPLGDDYSFVCGHGPGSTIGDERRTNPFLR
jgi:glyoxylase-like metal-dependent hydrolase (beta-lactamase superfamily II)